MNTMTTKSTQHAEPFADDVAYIADEGSLLLARAERMDLDRKMADAKEDNRRDTVGRRKSTHSSELQRQWSGAVEAEEKVRNDLERRIAATVASGKVLGLEALCRKYDLNAFERTVLVLAALVALDGKYETALGNVAHETFGSDVSPQAVWAYLEMDMAARIASRSAFSPSSALLKHGLVTMTWGRSASPYDLRSATVQIRQRAFDLIVGLPVDESMDDSIDPDGP